MADYNLVAALRSDRYADEVVISAGQPNMDNDANQFYVSQPAGFGLCLILELLCTIDGIGTADTAMSAQSGFDAYLVNPAGAVVDFVDSKQGTWVSYQNTVGVYSARLASDQPVLWKDAERLFIRAVRADTSAGDAADFSVFCRVRRLRGVGR